MTRDEVELKLRAEWDYMKGVVRSQTRVNATGEVFTPNWLVDEMVNEIPEAMVKGTFVDTSCGDGQLLVGVVLRKMMDPTVTLAQALSSIVGCDIMVSNVELCRARLSCGDPECYNIVKNNIIVANALTPTEEVEGQTTRDRVRAVQLFGDNLSRFCAS